MRINIVQHVSFEPGGMIIDWARDCHHDLTYTLLFEKNISWPLLAELDLLVILGGPMSVYDEGHFEWLKSEKAFIRQAIAANKIILGICLGSQLLAEALGARVYPNREKEIGFFPVTKTNDGKHDDVFNSIPETWDVFHWHGDTFSLPEGATHVFQSLVCEQQVFRKGKLTGIQFHPELDNTLLRSMIANEKHELIKAHFVQTEQEILDNDITEENRNRLYEILAQLTR